jgi:L-amino acid N-acyltransferase YncA
VIGKGFPYLVAAYSGEIVGYADASPCRLRPAYRYTAENSVYLHPAWSGRGIGGQLMCRRCLQNAKQEDFGRS